MKTKKISRFTFTFLIGLLLFVFLNFLYQPLYIFLVSPKSVPHSQETILAQALQLESQKTEDKTQTKIDDSLSSIIDTLERNVAVFFSSINVIFNKLPFNKLPYPFNSPDVLILIVIYALTLSFFIGIAIRVLTFALSPLTSWILGDFQKRYPKTRKEIHEENLSILNEIKEKKISLERSRNSVTQIDIILYNLVKIEDYYRLNIDQANQSFRLSIFLIVVGAVVIFATIYFALVNPNLEKGITIISGITGVVLEIVGGSALLLYGKAIVQLNRFFFALLRDQDTMLAIELSQNLKDMRESEYIYTTKQVISCLVDRSSFLNVSLSNLDDNFHDSEKGKDNPLKKQDKKEQDNKAL